MLTRRDVLLSSVAAGFAPSLLRSKEQSLIESRDLEYLKGLAAATIKRATRPESVEKVGFPVVSPGGNYPSYWIRDFSMAAGCGLIPPKALHAHLKLALRTQQGQIGWKLASGGYIPPGAIADHIRFDGAPLFYPGTYSPGEDQGGGAFGFFPPVDDHYEIVHIAWCLAQRDGVEFLEECLSGVTIFDRLVNAIRVPRIDESTGLVVTDRNRRAVGFGFCDTVVHTGKLLFASLLRERALEELASLAEMTDRPSSEFRSEAQTLRHSIRSHFFRDGWLIAATEVGQQPDVWGTAFAVYRGILDTRTEAALVDTLCDAYRRGTIAWNGGVRHVPIDHDWSGASAWEETVGVPLNRYQNGAYWHVPTGWLAITLSRKDPSLGRRLVSEMIEHLRKEDFREEGGAPWECLHPDGDYRQNPVYMASVTLPLEVLSRRVRPKSY